MRKTSRTSAISMQVKTAERRDWTQSFSQDVDEIRKTLTQEAVCEYIGDIAQELLAMANTHDQSFLAYLLGMAADEARSTARRMRLQVEHTS